MSGRRANRRGPSSYNDQSAEFIFTRKVRINCPVNANHKLGEIFQDVAETQVWENYPTGVFEHRGTRLVATCPWCAAGGEHYTFQVRWELVVALLDRMRKHGPSRLALPMTAEAIRHAAMAGQLDNRN